MGVGGSLCEDNHIVMPLNAGTIDFHGLNCPVASGEISVKLDINLLDSTVANDLITIDLSALSDKGDKLLCAALSVEQPALTSGFSCYGLEYCYKDEHPAMSVGGHDTIDGCCDACNLLPQCAGYVWKDNKCHLKANPDYVKTGCDPTYSNCFPCGMSASAAVAV